MLIGRFAQPDPLVPVPGNPQALNRYSYSLNNPLKYTDSSGHRVESALDIAFIAYGLYDISQNGLNWENGLSLAADVAGLILPARSASAVTGGGWLVRAAFRADEVAALARADEAVAFVQQSANAAQAANQAGNAMQGASQSARPPAAPNNPSPATSCATTSFTGDTLVATASGLVPIATLEVGDYVLAYDEDTQQLGSYEVPATWSHAAEQLIYVTVEGEVIKATANHPVYALGRGWIDAGALVPGDRLIEADGELGEVPES